MNSVKMMSLHIPTGRIIMIVCKIILIDRHSDVGAFFNAIKPELKVVKWRMNKI